MQTAFAPDGRRLVPVNIDRDMYRRHEAIIGIEVEVEVEVEVEADGPEKSAEQKEAVGHAYRAMEMLIGTQRQVVSLVDIAESSYADTESILGVPVGTVMSRFFRARKRLRDALEVAERRATAAQRGDLDPWVQRAE